MRQKEYDRRAEPWNEEDWNEVWTEPEWDYEGSSKSRIG